MSDAGTTTANLNLRAGPSTSAAILETLKVGSRVQILGPGEGPWLHVRAANSGREGFAHHDYLRIEAVANPASGPLLGDPALREVALPAATPREAPSGAGDAVRRAVRIWNEYGGLLDALAARLGIEPAAGAAVMAVESGGAAFVEGRMVIRFENHIFHDRWGKANPERFALHFRFDSGERWNGHEFRPTEHAPWSSFHGKQSGEWTVFSFAESLGRRAARESISMGLPQIMGFNASTLGYADADAMFDAFSDPARGAWAQVVGMFDFIRGGHGRSPMVDALRARDWVAFAKRYNGTGQAEAYGARLKAAYEAASG